MCSANGCNAQNDFQRNLPKMKWIDKKSVRSGWRRKKNNYIAYLAYNFGIILFQFNEMLANVFFFFVKWPNHRITTLYLCDLIMLKIVLLVQLIAHFMFETILRSKCSLVVTDLLAQLKNRSANWLTQNNEWKISMKQKGKLLFGVCQPAVWKEKCVEVKWKMCRILLLLFLF